METSTHGNASSNTGMGNGSDGTVNKASSTAHAAVDSFAGAADEAVHKARPAIDKVTGMAHQAVDKAAGAAAPAADWLAANPLKTIGIAVVAGILFGRIIR